MLFIIKKLGLKISQNLFRKTNNFPIKSYLTFSAFLILTVSAKLFSKGKKPIFQSKRNKRSSKFPKTSFVNQNKIKLF